MDMVVEQCAADDRVVRMGGQLVNPRGETSHLEPIAGDLLIASDLTVLSPSLFLTPLKYICTPICLSSDPFAFLWRYIVLVGRRAKWYGRTSMVQEHQHHRTSAGRHHR